jgi:hypothetical protein
MDRMDKIVIFGIAGVIYGMLPVMIVLRALGAV